MSVLALWLGNTLWGWSCWVLTFSLLVGTGLLVTGGIALRHRTPWRKC